MALAAHFVFILCLINMGTLRYLLDVMASYMYLTLHFIIVSMVFRCTTTAIPSLYIYTHTIFTWLKIATLIVTTLE